MRSGVFYPKGEWKGEHNATCITKNLLITAFALWIIFCSFHWWRDLLYTSMNNCSHNPSNKKRDTLMMSCCIKLNELYKLRFLFGNVLFWKLSTPLHHPRNWIQFYVQLLPMGHQSSSSTSWKGSGTVLTALNFPALFRCSFSNLDHRNKWSLDPAIEKITSLVWIDSFISKS